MLFPIDNLYEAVGMAKRILIKERPDRQLGGQGFRCNTLQALKEVKEPKQNAVIISEECNER